MKKPYLVIYESFESSDDETLFVEDITSNFISKKIRSNTYAIINDKGLSAKEIFDLIRSKKELNCNFLVTELHDFFGSFDTGGLDWLKVQFPELNWQV